jgi:hypothetical protein
MLKIERRFELISREIKDGEYYRVPKYIVGSNQLMFFYDGLLCIHGRENQYNEIGNKGEISEIIQVWFDIQANHELTIIIFGAE